MVKRWCFFFFVLTFAGAITGRYGWGEEGVRRLTVRFTFEATVQRVPERAKVLEIWLPVPSSDRWQNVCDLQVRLPALSIPIVSELTQERRYGNRMVYVRIQNPPASFSLSVSFTVTRKEVRVLKAPSPLVSGDKSDEKPLRLFLQPATLVPVGGIFRTIAERVTRGKGTRLEKARALYEHVVSFLRYDYDRSSPKRGQGDVAFVCDIREGNCCDIHSYFIALARSLGIPSFLSYGFPISDIPVSKELKQKGKIGGYHCWTWFYDPKFRWIPLDASDARRWLDVGRPDMIDYLFGNLVLERSTVEVTRGRDIILEPPQRGKPLNYFIYPYAEADGQPIRVGWVLTYEILREGEYYPTMGRLEQK